MITLYPRIVEEDVVAAVRREFERSLPEGSVRDVELDKFPGETFITIRVPSELLQQANALAWRINEDLPSSINPSYTVRAEPADASA